MVSMLKQELKANSQRNLGALLAQNRLRAMNGAHGSGGHGGAPSLGFNGIVVKAHGSARERAIANAIRVAAEKSAPASIRRSAEIARANERWRPLKLPVSVVPATSLTHPRPSDSKIRAPATTSWAAPAPLPASAPTCPRECSPTPTWKRWSIPPTNGSSPAPASRNAASPRRTSSLPTSPPMPRCAPCNGPGSHPSKSTSSLSPPSRPTCPSPPRPASSSGRSAPPAPPLSTSKPPARASSTDWKSASSSSCPAPTTPCWSSAQKSFPPSSTGRTATPASSSATARAPPSCATGPTPTAC